MVIDAFTLDRCTIGSGTERLAGWTGGYPATEMVPNWIRFGGVKVERIQQRFMDCNVDLNTHRPFLD